MDRCTVMVCTTTVTEQDTKVNGNMINSMETAKSIGLIMLATRVGTNLERNMAMVVSYGQMVRLTPVITTRTILMEMVSTAGQTAGNTMEHGKTTRCTVVEYSPGQMVDVTKDNM